MSNTFNNRNRVLNPYFYNVKTFLGNNAMAEPIILSKEKQSFSLKLLSDLFLWAIFHYECLGSLAYPRFYETVSC